MDVAKVGERFSKGTTRGQTYPVEDLLNIKQGAFSTMKNMKAEAKMMDELGTDMSLKVHIRVGLDNKGFAYLLPGSTINVVAGPTKAMNHLSGKMQYYATAAGNLSAKKSIKSATPVADVAKFKLGKGTVIDVESEKFTEGIMKLYPDYVAKALTTLKK